MFFGRFGVAKSLERTPKPHWVSLVAGEREEVGDERQSEHFLGAVEDVAVAAKVFF